MVLAGTKLDLREDKHFLADHPGLVPVTTAQGEELRKQIGAAYYIECSSKTQQNVKAVFDAAIKVVIKPPQKQKEKKTTSGMSHECDVRKEARLFKVTTQCTYFPSIRSLA